MPDELYGQLGTPIVWAATGGDEVLDLGGLAANAVRVGSYHDFLVPPQPRLFMAEINIDGFDTAPVIGHAVNLYISEARFTTQFTGPESPSDTTDGAGNVDRLPNLLGPMPTFVWSTTPGDNLVRMHYFTSWARYLAPVVVNRVDNDALLTAGVHTITITPLFWQRQSDV